MSRKGFSGLTVSQVITQSHLIHPDWTAEMHQWYLREEEGLTVDIHQVSAYLTFLKEHR